MAVAGSFWQRVARLVGGKNMSPPDDAQSAAPSRELAVADAPPAGVPWWRRRQVRQMHVREVSRRIVQLADGLEAYFRQQDERATELTAALQQVGGILQQLAEAQRQQGDSLRTIAQHAEAGARHAAALTETLGRLPDSLVTQAEAVRAVARQLEVAQESDTQLMHSLQQFGRAVDTLGSAGTSQVEVLQRLNAAQQEQHAALMTLVREQSRRFLLILFVGTILAVAGLGALGAALFLQWRL